MAAVSRANQIRELLLKLEFEDVEDDTGLQNHVDQGGVVITSDPGAVEEPFLSSFFIFPSNEMLRNACGKENSDCRLSVFIEVDPSSQYYHITKELKELVQSINMLTINCNHGKESSSRTAKDGAIKAVLSLYKPDIVFLQETPRKKLSYDSDLTEADPDYFISTDTPDARIMFSEQKFSDESETLSSHFRDEERSREVKQQSRNKAPLFTRVAKQLNIEDFHRNRLAYAFLRVKGEDRKLFILAVSWHSPYKLKTSQKVKILRELLVMIEAIINCVVQCIDFKQLITVLAGDFNVSIDEAENQLQRDFPSFAFLKCKKLSKRRREHNFDSFVMRSDAARQSNVYLRLPKEINSIHMEEMPQEGGVTWTSIDHDPVQATLRFT